MCRPSNCRARGVAQWADRPERHSTQTQTQKSQKMSQSPAQRARRLATHRRLRDIRQRDIRLRNRRRRRRRRRRCGRCSRCSRCSRCGRGRGRIRRHGRRRIRRRGRGRIRRRGRWSVSGRGRWSVSGRARHASGGGRAHLCLRPRCRPPVSARGAARARRHVPLSASASTRAASTNIVCFSRRLFLVSRSRSARWKFLSFFFSSFSLLVKRSLSLAQDSSYCCQWLGKF